jgi:hypothetical protein
MDWISLWVCRRVGMPSLAAAALAVVAAVTWAETPEPGEIRVARLVRDLGAADYSKRQAADDQLAKLGHQSRSQLEQALEHSDAEVRLRARRLLERLKLDELWAGSRVRLTTHGEPASKILLGLAAQTGNHIYIGDPYGNFAEKKLDATGASMGYWEAVDWICGESGNRVRPHYDMHTPGIVISAGAPGNYPRAYAGPLRAQITSARRVFIEELSYEDQKAELTHSFQINLQFTWEDRFRIVGYASQPQLVEAVTDERLAVSAAQPSGGGWNATTRGLRQVAASLKLNPVPITAKTLDVFKIKWGLIAVGEPAVFEIAQPEPGRQYAQDDVDVRVESIEKQPAAKYLVSLNVARDLAMPEPQEVIFQEYEAELLDGEGRPFRLQSCSPSLDARGVQLKLAFGGESPDSQPKSLKLHYPRVRARRDVELLFRNVPLPTSKPE